MSEILLKGSQRKVNEEQAKAIPAQILQGWEDLTKKGKALIIQREQMEAYAQDVLNRYDLGQKGLDIEAQEATIDNLIAQTSNEKVKKGLILGQIRVADAEEELKRNTADWTKDKAEETRWNIKSLQKGIDKLVEEVNGKIGRAHV